MFKRLKEPTGEVADNSPQKDDSNDKVVRPAILVHAGPGGDKMTFMSGDGEISFDKARIMNVIKNHNAKLSALAEQYGGIDKMPVGAWPPILDQHENDSNDRVIGRLASLLRYEERDIPKVGKKVPAALADITFLGEDTVKRVKDGRIYHLSIGIDEDTDTLGETSTVVTPAAPGAMLLNKGKAKSILHKGDKKMGAKVKKLKAAFEKRSAKLSEMKESLTKLTSKLESTRKDIKLTARKGEVTHRLTNLMRSGRLTPAEYKKMDIKKLAALDDSSLNTVVESFENREPVIDPTQRGTTDATTFSDLAKGMAKSQMKRLKGETLKDFKKLGKKLNAEMEAELEDLEDPKEDAKMKKHMEDLEEEVKDDAGKKMSSGEMKKHLEDLKKHLESGDVEKAKESHAALAKCAEESKDEKHMEMGDVKSEDYKKSMDTLQGQIDELNTQMARMGGMVEEMMAGEKEEGHDLEELEELEEEKKDDKKPDAAAAV